MFLLIDKDKNAVLIKPEELKFDNWEDIRNRIEKNKTQSELMIYMRMFLKGELDGREER